MQRSRHTGITPVSRGCLPLRCSRNRRVVARYNPDEELVKKKVKQLVEKEGIDQAHARRVVARHKQRRQHKPHWNTDPFIDPLSDENQNNIRFLNSKLFYDAVTCFVAYEAAIYIDANASFVGKALWVFLFSAVSFAYVLLFLYELRLLVWAVILQIRWYLTKLELLDCIVLVAALKEIARPSSFDSVTKVQSAIDYYKAPQSLENEDQCPKGQAEDRSIKMTTAESLAVFFILDEAREKHGFTREEYGLSAAEASIIAHVFTKYATKVDGRMHCSELQRLCTDTGQDLSEDEGKAAVQAISHNANGFIEFNEFVGFWVNPSETVVDLKSISEADRQGGGDNLSVGTE